MPTLQIIGQEAIEDQNNQVNQRLKQQELQQSAYEKVIQFKQMSQELKLKAKANENEIERNRLLGLANRMDYIAKTYDVAAKYPDPNKVLRRMWEISGDDILKTMADSSVRPMLRNMSDIEPAAEAQKQLAESRQLEQTAGLLGDIRAQMPRVLDTGLGAIEGGQGGQGGQGAPNQPAVNAIQGGPVGAPGVNEPAVGWGNINISDRGVSVNLENWREQARGAAMKTAATTQATRDIEMEPIKASVGNYLQTFDRAVKEMGGLENSALAALAKGKMAELGAQIGEAPNIFTLSKLIEPVSLQLGSWLNKGRPTDKDQAAAKATLTRLTYTKGANEILRNYLLTIINTGNQDLSTKLFWSLAKMGGSNSADARAFGDSSMLSGEPATKRFIIREK